MNNIPVHAPLYTPTLTYGSNDCESLCVLVEVGEAEVRELLDPTPFDYLAPYAWVEVVVLNDTFGVAPFASGGVVVPARHVPSGVDGGYYAFCYIDTDEALALGREPFGYPKKYANVTIARVGDTAKGTILCDSATIKIDATLDRREIPSALPPRYPHLLLQVIPAAESDEILLKRVLERNTAAGSTFVSECGAGTVGVATGPKHNELAWLEGSKPVATIYSRGEFRSAYARVLETLDIGSELWRALRPVSSIDQEDELAVSRPRTRTRDKTGD
jgi:acetoacetate decarboxylase